MYRLFAMSCKRAIISKNDGIGGDTMLNDGQISADTLTRYIQDNACRPLTLDDMAKYMHMSRTYACEVFHRITGRSFSECVIQAHLERALTLLQGDDKMCCIYRACGFSSETTFYRTFKHAFGMTPSKYRASILSKDSTPKHEVE
jgi:AraC-like DNA-binding protein